MSIDSLLCDQCHLTLFSSFISRHAVLLSHTLNIQIFPFLGLFSLNSHIALCKALNFGPKIKCQEQNYENAFTLNILYWNICNVNIGAFGQNSNSDMLTFRNWDVKRFKLRRRI